MIFEFILQKCKEEGKRRNQEWIRQGRYEDLYTTPFLYSSAELSDMADNARTKKQYESVLDHLYRHETLDIDSYQRIESNIIDQYYERGWIK
jgi:hypothetical protein